MNISISIDVCNAEHVQALAQFMAALGGQTTATPTGVLAAPVINIVTEEKPKKGPIKKAAPVVPIEETPEVETQEDQTTEEVETEEASAVDLETLRGSVGALVKLDRSNADKIKAKLAEFGVASVSTLDPKDFGAFYTYIKSIS